MTLKDKIKNSGLKISFIAKSLDLSREALYHKLDGKSEFKVSEMVKLSSILNLTVKERNKYFFTFNSDLKSR